MFFLELRGIRKFFDAVCVLDGVDLQLSPTESVAIVGASGSGKTTLLQICGLLDQDYSGDLFLQGRLCPKRHDNQLALLRREMLGFVYQSPHLMPEMTVLENVMLPALIARLDRKQARLKAEKALHVLGITQAQHSRTPRQLSGGENQRVAIARALCRMPLILLADEPTGNLDEDNANLVFDILLKASREYGVALLVITHNKLLAQRLDRTMILSGGLLTQG